MEFSNKDILYWDHSNFSIKIQSLEGMDHFGVLAESHKDLEVIYSEIFQRQRSIEIILKKSCLVSGKHFCGIGADLGAGSGIGAAILSKYSTVNKVYAVDYSKEFIKRIMPITFQKLKADSSKIIRVVGSYNHIKLRDETLDFAIEIGAFHHSEDIYSTLKELYRVLKPGGWFVALERAHRNNRHNSYLEKTLDVELPPAMKKRYGIPEDKSVTRRDWGEHEYRMCDWVSLLAKQGFRVFAFNFVGIDFIVSEGKRLERWFAEQSLKICFGLIGDYLLKKRFYYIPFFSWFDPTYTKTLLVCQKL